MEEPNSSSDSNEEIRLILNSYPDENNNFNLILESFLLEREEETLDLENLGGCSPCVCLGPPTGPDGMD